CNGLPFYRERQALRPFPTVVVTVSRLRLPFPRSERGCSMTEKLKRRDVVKAVAAAGGGLAGGGAAGGAARRKKRKSAVVAVADGKQDQPWAIFQQGGVLLLVNENGDLATGRITKDAKFVVLHGDGWEEGLVGELAKDGKAISWANGTTWKRP